MCHLARAMRTTMLVYRWQHMVRKKARYK